MTELGLEDVVIPDVAEPLLGFRTWRVEDRTLTLWPATQGDLPKGPGARRLLANVLANPDGAWPPGETFEATCKYRNAVKDHGDDIPDQECGCGPWATSAL